MRIFNLQKMTQREDVKLSVSIESERLGTQELWFSTPKQYADGLCDTRMDGFLVGMLFPAMQYGEDIHLEGCVSKKLLFNLNNYAIPLLMAFSPSSKAIKITADQLSAERFDAKGIGTGFSAGVDSFCTVYDRYEMENDPDYKVNSFLFLNVGSHACGGHEGDLNFQEKKFRQRYSYLKRFPDEIGLPFIPLNSNLHAFHPWGHQKTCTLTLVSGLLIMQAEYRRYYISSLGWSYTQMFEFYKTDINKDIAFLDPVVLPIFSTESMELIPDGTHYTRVQKTMHIVKYEPAKRYLNVCISGEGSHENCSICGKCSRTLMTLSSAGLLSEFEAVFNSSRYKEKAEKRFVREQVLLQSTDPFAQGNIELAKKRGVKLPSVRAVVVLKYILSPKRTVKRVVFKIVKHVLPDAVRVCLKKKYKRGN